MRRAAPSAGEIAATRVFWSLLRISAPVEPATDVRLPPGPLVLALRQALRMGPSEFAGRICTHRSTVDRIERGQHEGYAGLDLFRRLKAEALRLGWRRVAEAFETYGLLARAKRERAYRNRTRLDAGRRYWE